MTSLERSSILRAFFSLITLQTWFCGMYEPLSMHYAVTKGGHTIGLIVISLFAILGTFSLLDTIINDIMDEQYNFHWVLKIRHLVFMFMAILYVAELFVSLKFTVAWGLITFDFLVATFIIITAFYDVQIRFMDKSHG